MLEKIVFNTERFVLENLGVNFISMDYVDGVILNLAQDIREDRANFKPQMIVGVTNGGFYPTKKLAKELHLKYELLEANRDKIRFAGLNLSERFVLGRLISPYSKTKPILREKIEEDKLAGEILLIDDDCGSGKTLNLVKTYLESFSRVKKVKTACLFCYEGRERVDYIGELVPKLNSFMAGSKRLPWCDVSPHAKNYQEKLQELVSQQTL